MEIVNSLEDFQLQENAVVTIGMFDGVHVGHCTILNQIVQEAKSMDAKSVVITFWPHPQFILQKKKNLKLLSTFDEKKELIERVGVDFLVRLEFTSSFSQLPADDFIRKILIEKVNTKKLYIGYDHHFGKNREGNIDFLKAHKSKYGLETKEIPKQDVNQMTISSTKIRNALKSGNITLANALLGRNYSFTALVVHGKKNGRKIGFPTANLMILEPYKLTPRDGSYVVRVTYEKKNFGAMMNIGCRPTLRGFKRPLSFS